MRLNDPDLPGLPQRTVTMADMAVVCGPCWAEAFKHENNGMAWYACGYIPFTRYPAIKLHREEYMREQQLKMGKPVPYSKRELKGLFPAE